MSEPGIVAAADWQKALAEMLVREKEFTRARDELAAMRRRMPWTPVRKQYWFQGPEGPVTLRDLFAGRRQLIVYRAFMDPGVAGWPERGCVGCSLMADHIPDLSHLHARDTTLVYVSRGSQDDITRIKQQMGWTMPWFTMVDSEDGFFDADFDVDEWHGTNAFIRHPDTDEMFRTYFVNNRGDEAFVSTWSLLDITALGRQETWEDSPPGYPQSPPYQWWRHHDLYDSHEQRNCCAHG